MAGAGWVGAGRWPNADRNKGREGNWEGIDRSMAEGESETGRGWRPASGRVDSFQLRLTASGRRPEEAGGLRGGQRRGAKGPHGARRGWCRGGGVEQRSGSPRRAVSPALRCLSWRGATARRDVARGGG
jgi:hypothetical protein